MSELFLFSEFVVSGLPLNNGSDERARILAALHAVMNDGRCRLAAASHSVQNYRSFVDTLEHEPPTILHICGHGAERKLMVTASGISAAALDLGDLLKDLKIPKFKLIFLNACSTRQTALDVAHYADCIICYLDRVRNSEATKMAGAFYRHLAEGLTIRESFEQAKAECPVGTDRQPPKLLPAGAGHNVLFPQREVAPDLAALIREYLDALPGNLAKTYTDDPDEQQELLAWLNTGFVPPAGDVRVQRGLPARVIDSPWKTRRLMPGLTLSAEGRMTGAVERGFGAEQSSVEYAENVPDLIRRQRWSVILGEPGAGKTCLLMRLAMDYRNAYSDPRSDVLPVFVPLAKYDGAAADFEAFCAWYLGELADFVPELRAATASRAVKPHAEARPALKVVWLFDALNEMPRGQGQMDCLKRFVVSRLLAGAETGFILTCRVKNYEDEFRQVDGLYRVDLQDLNPQQIYDLLTAFVSDQVADGLWKEVFRAGDLLKAWKAWIERTAESEDGSEEPKDRSVRRFWAYPDGPAYGFSPHKRARAAVHADPRQLLLLCRNPFTLVRLLLPEITRLLQEAFDLEEEGIPYVAEVIDGNRAALFQSVTRARLEEEAGRHGWGAGAVERVNRMLERAAAALQATEQRTEMPCPDLLALTTEFPDAEDLLLKARDAGLLMLSQPLSLSTVRFTHQLFQEYYATSKLSALLEEYSRKHPEWEDEAPLPLPDEGLKSLFPNWWDIGAWRVTSPMFAQLQGKTGIHRVVRWLAGYAPEIALTAVLDNNDGMKLDDLADKAIQALKDGARARVEESHPVGRAAAYRVLGQLGADSRPGVGLRSDGVPDIAWAEPVPPGMYPVGGDEKAYDSLPAEQFPLRYSYELGKYPVTNAQFQAFVDAGERGYNAREYWTDAGWEWKGERTGPEESSEGTFRLPNHPRIDVSWYEAVAFCSWLTARYLDLGLRYEVRLPTEIEWEIAARGKDGRAYPYGNEFDPLKGNVYATEIGATSAVGIFPDGASPFGVLDMSGNVWEWCLTEYETRTNDRAGAAARVCRGGSWDSYDHYARAGARDYDPPYSRNAYLGFRVVRLPHPN